MAYNLGMLIRPDVAVGSKPVLTASKSEFRFYPESGSEPTSQHVRSCQHATSNVQVAQIGIGGSLAAPPLPHHRTYGSVYGGSLD